MLLIFSLYVVQNLGFCKLVFWNDQKKGQQPPPSIRPRPSSLIWSGKSTLTGLNLVGISIIAITNDKTVAA